MSLPSADLTYNCPCDVEFNQPDISTLWLLVSLILTIETLDIVPLLVVQNPDEGLVPAAPP